MFCAMPSSPAWPFEIVPLYSPENFCVFPMCGQTQACTFPWICLMWFLSWWTHSWRMSSTRSQPTLGCWPPRFLVLVPRVDLRILRSEENLDTAREATPLRLDQVPDHLVDRPFPLARVKRRHGLGQRLHLGADGGDGALEERGDVSRCKVLGHGR